ncbi:Uncharacterised protein [Stutzerimonas stutzeri]|nr:Uncharacterised protein [Stutzerimonas stutzeri]
MRTYNFVILEYSNTVLQDGFNAVLKTDLNGADGGRLGLERRRERIFSPDMAHRINANAQGKLRIQIHADDKRIFHELFSVMAIGRVPFRNSSTSSNN